MNRYAIAFAAVLGAAACLPARVHAQTVVVAPAEPGATKGFTYCSVMDMGNHTFYASPIFEMAWGGAADARTTRAEGLSKEFHALVTGMGGGGDKSCFPPAASIANLQAQRDEWKAVWTKRVLIYRSKWVDVPFTPQPWSEAIAAAKPAVTTETRYFYCYATDVDPAVRKTVASLVFPATLAADPMARYTAATAYENEFKANVIPQHGIDGTGTFCQSMDTQAEAEKSRKDYRKMFSGLNLKFVDLAWRPAP